MLNEDLKWVLGILPIAASPQSCDRDPGAWHPAFNYDVAMSHDHVIVISNVSCWLPTSKGQWGNQQEIETHCHMRSLLRDPCGPHLMTGLLELLSLSNTTT